jgi:hypothetical protein
MAAVASPSMKAGVSGPLTVEETADLARLEGTIKRGEKAFRETALALLEILERRLYREGWGNFDDYCRVRWSFQKNWGFKLASAARVILDQEKKGLPAPANCYQAARIRAAREKCLPAEQAPEINEQVRGHLLALEELHASHLCASRASEILKLYADVVLPWPPI